MEFGIGLDGWQGGTTLLGPWVISTPLMTRTQGGPHAPYTILRSPPARSFRPRLLPPHLSTIPCLDRRRNPHHRATHRLQSPPLRRRTRPRRPVQLPARPLHATLVDDGPGTHPHPIHPQPFRRRRARHARRGRHGRRAPRRQGL